MPLIFRFIEEKKTADEYVEKVLEITNNDKEEADIRKDARHYISHMLEMGLLFEEYMEKAMIILTAFPEEAGQNFWL